ncbi:hypothetical protein P153DRAFT_315711 [Dothidotthia symphoricarpi CBS 119687]|uniref:RING-type domain-containing protein n=1 Tax=Dothidotthia symphoricarpi CBS 119687 TaxID=1392245 RepID=A0A6A6AG35_9PLEO|nr:uncharacterized protein P153DRAFT_315711 [Dothidotthia symphoricarpi CBS 119687]KAF2130085.1 hypothetical protein P153DRAFT_315711 [Dothidotthia symphoricarpi CBS 119687]
MGIVKSRGATKKLEPMSIGRGVVRFMTQNGWHRFTVHEDLICANSKLFKNRLQKNRKAIEGECSVCTEELSPKRGVITFCRAECGQNIHEKCIERWQRSQNGPTTCPICRKAWKAGTEEMISLDDELDRDAVQLYLDWLYTGNLLVDEPDEDDEHEDINLPLLMAWTVSRAVDDKNFKHAIIAEMVSRTRSFNYAFWFESMAYAFEKHPDEEMKEFLVESFLTCMESGWFKEWADLFPNSFVQAIGEALFDGMTQKPKYAEIVKKYTNGEYKLV